MLTKRLFIDDMKRLKKLNAQRFSTKLVMQAVIGKRLTKIPDFPQIQAFLNKAQLILTYVIFSKNWQGYCMSVFEGPVIIAY